MAKGKSKGYSKDRVRDVADAGKPAGPDKKVASTKKAAKNTPDAKGAGPMGWASKKSVKMPKGCGK
jgi:hypothetical protein